MEFLCVNGKNAIFLDHCALINNIYNESISNQKEKYELKKELFNFTTTNQENGVQKGGRKRKVSEDMSIEISKFQKTAQSFLSELNQRPKAQQENSHHIARYWDEHIEYPTFSGANLTGAFQRINLAEHKYIIPPNCTFFNANIEELTARLQVTEQFDLIVIDPPWRNKYIRRLKRINQGLGYHMLYNKQLQEIPLSQLVHCSSLVAIWCTNSKIHQKTLVDEFLPAWNLRLLHKLEWLKINVNGQMIGNIKAEGQKQPFEMLYIACHKNCDNVLLDGIRDIEMCISVPSIVHSHKPPLVQWLSKYLPESPKCLELFARYLQPNFTSFGLEVLKLMDERLYTHSTKETD